MKDFILTNSELKTFCESVYDITSKIENFPIVMKAYNTLKKYSSLQSINDILNHVEMIYGNSVKSDLIGTNYKGNEDFNSLNFEDLEKLVKNHTYSYN